MDFKRFFGQYIQAVEGKNLEALRRFIPEKDRISAVLQDGTVLEGAKDFLEFHKEWFSDSGWSIKHDIVTIEETDEMSYVLVEASYFAKDDGKPYHIGMHNTYIMRKVDSKWLLVHMQQTEMEE